MLTAGKMRKVNWMLIRNDDDGNYFHGVNITGDNGNCGPVSKNNFFNGHNRGILRAT